MNANKFTEMLAQGFTQAQNFCKQQNYSEITAEIIIKILAEQPQGLVGEILSQLGPKINNFKKDLDNFILNLPKITGDTKIYLAPEIQDILLRSEKYQKKFDDQFISTDIFLLAALESKNLAKILQDNNLVLEDFREIINHMRKGQSVQDQNPESKVGALDKYTHDLTQDAHEGKLDPVIGRDEEIRRTIQVLSRRTKNNPVLIGEPGVGKTAIAEGIALRITKKDVPESMRDKKLLALDLASLLAGAKYRGEFEDRLRALLKAVNKEQGKIILFIDEMHTLVGAGGADGALDASNMLKPALARGELRCIGATTLDEYRKHVEKDAALERRFQPVIINQPTEDDTIAILRGLKERYEVHHGIRISDAAIISAVMLSNRYITHRQLPDKAIDLIDEAASALKMQIESEPAILDEQKRQITRLEVARQALSKEKDEGSKKRLHETEKELEQIKEKARVTESKYQNEKAILSSIRECKQKIEQCRHEIETSQRDGDFEKAAKLQYGDLFKLDKTLKQKSQELQNIQKNSSFLKEVVGEEEIAQVISRWTGIPISKMLQSEQQRLLTMESEIEQQIISQKEAIHALCRAIRRNRAGLSDERKPIGSFLFLGPTGVGKTELAKILAEFLFDDKKAMIRLDMSEYMERHSVSRLIGAPPGYVGYEEGGQLTEPIRRRPYAILLLDEMEKAHPEVFNILLQLLDDGRLTDSQGRTVDFRNTIILMTSNIGSEFLQDGVTSESQKQVMNLVKSHFRPEFLNRLDDLILFSGLSQEDLLGIINIMIVRINKRLKQQNLKLEVSPEAKQELAQLGYNKAYGARPLERVLQKHVLDIIAQGILEKKYQSGQTIKISLKNKNLEFA